MHQLVLTPLLAAVLVLAAGCAYAGAPRIEGSGVSKTESRDVPEFTGVRAVGAIDVTITIGQRQSVSITADDNLIALIKSEVKDGVLTVGHDGRESISHKTACRAEIVLPALHTASLAGSGSVVIKGLREEKLDLAIAGSGELSAQGTVERSSATVSGSGSMDLSDLVAAQSTAKIAGSGEIIVHATESLDASIAGSGTISYIGSPRSVKRNVTGSGAVQPKG